MTFLASFSNPGVNFSPGGRLSTENDPHATLQIQTQLEEYCPNITHAEAIHKGQNGEKIVPMLQKRSPSASPPRQKLHKGRISVLDIILTAPPIVKANPAAARA